MKKLTAYREFEVNLWELYTTGDTTIDYNGEEYEYNPTDDVWTYANEDNEESPITDEVLIMCLTEKLKQKQEDYLWREVQELVGDEVVHEGKFDVTFVWDKDSEIEDLRREIKIKDTQIERLKEQIFQMLDKNK
jgi:hypothetical protein